LSMTRCFLGDEAFFGGLNDYLNQFKQDNPSSKDLFDAWDKYLTDNSLDTTKSYIDQNDPLCGVIGKNTKQPTLPVGKTTNDVLDTWTRQMGYPFIKVNSKTDGDDKRCFGHMDSTNGISIHQSQLQDRWRQDYFDP